jgi:hypothetical protein
MDLPAHFQFDVTARYVDSLPKPHVPQYCDVDVRIAWQYRQFEVAIVGQNILDNQHPEFDADQEVPRSIYGKLTWRF